MQYICPVHTACIVHTKSELNARIDYTYNIRTCLLSQFHDTMGSFWCVYYVNCCAESTKTRAFNFSGFGTSSPLLFIPFNFTDAILSIHSILMYFSFSPVSVSWEQLQPDFPSFECIFRLVRSFTSLNFIHNIYEHSLSRMWNCAWH